MKTGSGKTGFSLIEVMIGLGVLAGIAAISLVVIQGSARETKFSAEHFSSIFLTQKVVEDLCEEISVNPHGFSTLGIDGGTAVPVDVTDGGASFFSSLADRKPPWNSIDPLTDGRIDSSFQPLYGQLKTFRCSVGATLLPSSGSSAGSRNLYQADVGFRFKAEAGTGDFSSACLFFSPLSGKKVENPLSVNPADVEAEFCSFYYLTPTGQFSQLVAQFGGTVTSVTPLARLHFAVRQFLSSPYLDQALNQIRTDEQQLAAIPPSQPGRIYDCRLRLAEAWYEISRNAIQVLLFIEKDLEQVRREFDAAHMGQYIVDMKGRYARTFSNVRFVHELLLNGMKNARSHYAGLLDGDPAELKGGRRQNLNLNRLLDLYRVLAVVPQHSTGAVEYRTFLQGLIRRFEGRNPVLFRYATQEATLLATPGQLRQRYSNLETLAAFLADRLSPLLQFAVTKSRV